MLIGDLLDPKVPLWKVCAWGVLLAFAYVLEGGVRR